MPVSRFCERLGIPVSTWYYWRKAHLQGRPTKRWPAPVVDALEEPAAQKAFKYTAWGHRKIWAMLRSDGVMVSQSSVKRALARRELLLPARYQAERRNLARARKFAFENPPSRRNRVWQMDFSEYETLAGGTWRICGVVDYVAKLCLACSFSATKTALDAVVVLEAAIARLEELLDCRFKLECVNPETGEIEPIVVVTDNGPGFKSSRFSNFMAAHPELTHVRTRHRAPQTNGVIERFFGSLKYEHLYRLEINTAQELHDELVELTHLYNMIRPHESLVFSTPISRYLQNS